MDCLDSLDKIFEYIDGNILDDELLDEIEEHLEHCKRCYDVVEFEKKVQEFVKKSVRCEDVPDETCNRAKEMLKKFSKI